MRALSIILGGGRGTRLFPLTKERAKPAVPFAGKYRLVDIPISNSIHAGLKHIYVLTQYNSVSLHNHIAQTFMFDSFSRGFVQILAAEQTLEHSHWYGGNADAVRQNLAHFRGHKPEHFVILSGDQLYRMDLGRLVETHVQSGADLTLAAQPVTPARAAEMGLLRCNSKGHITDFLEKPGPLTGHEPHVDQFLAPAGLVEGHNEPRYLASMGIYVFKYGILKRALDNTMTDFGREVIPKCIETMDVRPYIFDGYWEDIGTIRNYYDVNINLASPSPGFDFYDNTHPIYTRRRDLPSTRIEDSRIERSLAADGCVIMNARIRNSLVGIRTQIRESVELEGVFCMGADYYESRRQLEENRELGIPDIGIGPDCRIRRTIIDKNVRIGEGCRIGLDETDRPDGDYKTHSVRSGVVVLPKGAVVSPGTTI